MKIKIPNKNEHRCRQIKCSFYIDGNCQSCSKCSASPYIINNDCKKCWSCESEEGELRWGDKDNMLKQSQREVAKKVLKSIIKVMTKEVEDLEKNEMPKPKEEEVFVR